MRTENVVELAVWIAFVAVEMICLRGVFRYYRQLARQQQCSADVRRTTSVFTTSGVDSGGQIPTLTLTVSPPSYDEIIADGTPKYTVTSDGRVVPNDTKPPDYTP
ncbi:hypothetical protein NP493_122g07081 [Ridgeia piscesae]|uniref:Uncharacterized protein n=1 Tax=Ridgeia piscesae TaxID=27915 RepID=A0AAD9UGP5_RIDPI|nr:hypothetical protein NP493_122g07081 [Ridgeia piscesae]